MSNRCKRPIASLLVLALIGGCASSSGGANEGGYRSQEEKSPFVATLLAIFPGFFVHGIGNWYAGKNNRRDELLEREGLGLGCMVIGAGLGGLGYLEHVQGDKSKGFEMVLHRIGEVGSFVGAGGFVGFGLICFFDSWIRDIMEAGDAAEDKNRQLRQNYDIHQPLKPDAATADSITVGSPDLPSTTRIATDPR
ncbi:MAG: hypothetical protein ACAI25_02630 [Planctomycetota bacterium]